MAKYKIRHALASWLSEDGIALTAFRGQVAEIPDNEAKRLGSAGAIIPADEELVRPGIIQELPQSPSDEELVTWVSSANVDEVSRLVKERPELLPRVEATVISVDQARGAEATHLEEVRRALNALPTNSEDNSDIHVVPSSLPTGGIEDIDGSTPPSGSDPTDTSADGDEDIHFDNDLTPPPMPVDYKALVSSLDVDGISTYLSEHPESAEEILAAETENTNGQPRAGVVVAVRTAAEFNQG